jgi:hypothetical protein
MMHFMMGMAHELRGMPVADHFVAAIPPRDDHPRRTEIGKWTLVGASVLGSLLASFNLIGALVDSV